MILGKVNPQRCGVVDNPHIFASNDSPRCQLCNIHIRDVHVSDHLTDTDETVTCKCGNNCEATSKDTDCACFNIPCEDDEGLCEHLRGCLHGECECECEF
jgi:hypothetical protein